MSPILLSGFAPCAGPYCRLVASWQQTWQDKRMAGLSGWLGWRWVAGLAGLGWLAGLTWWLDGWLAEPGWLAGLS